jgi:hypothetical protein
MMLDQEIKYLSRLPTDTLTKFVENLYRKYVNRDLIHINPYFDPKCFYKAKTELNENYLVYRIIGTHFTTQDNIFFQLRVTPDKVDFRYSTNPEKEVVRIENDIFKTEVRRFKIAQI